MIGSLFEKFICLGTKTQFGLKHNQVTRLINKICPIFIALVTPNMLLTYYFNSIAGAVEQLVSIFLMCLTVYINSKYFLKTARVMTLLIGMIWNDISNLILRFYSAMVCALSVPMNFMEKKIGI